MKSVAVTTFLFALLALSTSELLSQQLEKRRTALTGVATVLADPAASSADMARALSAIIEPCLSEPSEDRSFPQAMNLILAYNAGQEPFDQETVQLTLDGIKENMIDYLVTHKPDVADFFEISLQEVVGSMKHKLVDQLIQQRRNGEKIHITDRVKKLHDDLLSHFSTLLANKEISDGEFNMISWKIEKNLPSSYPQAEGLAALCGENIELFEKPQAVVTEALLVRVGEAEARIAELETSPSEAALQITTLLTPVLTEANQSLSTFLEALLSDWKEVSLNPSQALGPKARPDVVRNTQEFLAEIISFASRKVVDASQDRYTSLFERVREEIREIVRPLDARFIRILAKSGSALAEENQEDFFSAELGTDKRRYQKFRELILLANEDGETKPEKAAKFLANFEQYAILAKAEIAALNLATEYFDPELSVRFEENNSVFLSMLDELIKLISSTDLETLTAANLFPRLEQRLAREARDAVEPTRRWRVAVLRIANSLLCHEKGFELPDNSFDVYSLSVFTVEAQRNLFRPAHKKNLLEFIDGNPVQVDEQGTKMEDRAEKDMAESSRNRINIELKPLQFGKDPYAEGRRELRRHVEVTFVGKLDAGNKKRQI